MTSPNFSQYVDLTIYDIDAFQVYNDAVAYARDSVPEFQPRTGTLEEAIMQAVSYNTALLSSQINRLPDGLMEGIARLSGLERLEATFATGNATFEVFDDNGITIPVGTVIAYEIVNDDIVTSYTFETTADLIIPELSTTGNVAIRATEAGVYPALLAGQELELVSPAPGVVAVELQSAISVGTDTETDIDYFNRATRHFASLSNALVTKTQLLNYIRNKYSYVGSLAVFDLTNSTSLSWAAADAPGYVTIVLSDLNGFALTGTQETEILEDITAKTVAGLSVDAVAPSPANVTCEVDISVANGFSDSEVRDAVEAYLTNRFSAVGYDYSGIIIRNEIIASISNIAGVRYVKTLTLDTTESAEITVDGITGDLSFVAKNGTPDGVIEVTSS
jgi:hypothetical protein